METRSDRTTRAPTVVARPPPDHSLEHQTGIRLAYGMSPEVPKGPIHRRT
jgi:hypothetical protein